MYCPSKKKQGSAFIIARPDEKIIMCLHSNMSDSGHSELINEYFGIQSDIITVR